MSNLLNALRAFDRTVDESYYTAKDSGSNEKLEKLFDDWYYKNDNMQHVNLMQYFY